MVGGCSSYHSIETYRLMGGDTMLTVDLFISIMSLILTSISLGIAIASIKQK